MAKKIFYITLFLCVLHGCREEHMVSELQNQPINDLLKRVAPDHVDSFSFELDSAMQDAFSLRSMGNRIIIKGNNYNSMAVGLNFYLKNYCKTYVSWYKDDPIELPNVLPKIDGTIRKDARLDHRFFLNYCTFGYTMPWWQWREWEHFIDWMALNGINLPLAITGQEAIWYEVWEEYGLADAEIRGYFTGPAHLPWHRMSNLDKWGGPLPASWLEHQKELQKKIVKRERELGMKPVLPAFAGHVPEALKTKFPKAKISQLSSWGGFGDEYRSFFLDPLDPLFKDIQRRFLSKQTELYGTDHIYGADPFNEVHPPSWEPDYLATVSETIYTSMKEVDPKATWLQMTWIFYFEREHWTNDRIEAMITAVPKGKMILLDYFGENQEVWKMTKSYFDLPFIWNYLGNFGGNTMMVGNLDETHHRISNTLQNAGDNVVGIGSTLEAFDVNPLMYSFVFENAWEEEMDTQKWIEGWADMRFGSPNENNRRAWKILHKNIYAHPTALGQGTLTNARPTLTGSGNWTTNPAIAYDNHDLYKAWALMLTSPSEIRDTYNYDIVNLGRQYLGNYFIELRDSFTLNYKSRNLEQLRNIGVQMTKLLDDLDTLLATHESFLLGNWLNSAKAIGIDEKERDYYEFNARNIITTWGTSAQSLNDYANRSWAGLTKDYYKKRWEMFISDVITSVENNKKFDEEAFFKKVTQFEWQWANQKNEFSDIPTGDPVLIAKELATKYDPQQETSLSR
ncbi:MAG: alpha-N-acetylglucosaminidase [Allomuricauda sp.]